MLKKISENELIKKCLWGNEAAWEELYKRYYKLVRKIIFYPRWNFKFELAEDLVQEVFIEIVKALKNFRSSCKLSTFIAKIAQNKCISILRKELSQKKIKNELLISLEEKHSSDGGFIQIASSQAGPEEIFLRNAEAEKIKKALKNLKKECFSVLYLRYFEEKSYREIADTLNLPLGTVCIQIKRCLQTFRKFYLDLCD